MPKIPEKPAPKSILEDYFTYEDIKRLEYPRPVWLGPEDSSDRGGITFSLLNLFLSDRERFRLRVIEGLRSETWSHRLFYGNCWHLCEEVNSNFKAGRTKQTWEGALFEYCKKEANEYKFRQEEIQHWYRVCKVQFPIYLQYWGDSLENPNSRLLLSEYSFKVPYTLPNGRIIYLRGKWDEVSIEDNGIWITDHKSKGDIDEIKIQRQLRLDLQTQLYVIALERFDWREQFDIMKSDSPLNIYGKVQIKGVKYNVIRRPLSGGTGTIRRHKATKHKPEETLDHFYDRVRDVILEDPDNFFMRWTTPISHEDIDRFKKVCFNGIMQQLCDWYDWVSSSEGLEDPYSNSVHYLMPYGLYNPLTEGTPTELDRCIETGSIVGLSRVENLFPEL